MPSLMDLLLALTRHEDPALAGQALCAYAAAAACYLAHGFEMLDPPPHPWPELWSEGCWRAAPDALEAQAPGWHLMREEVVGRVVGGMREASAGVRRLAIEAAASLLLALVLVSCASLSAI